MPAAYGAELFALTGTTGRSDLVVIEGIHAYKHARRFGAHLEAVVTVDRATAASLLAELAPDVELPDDVYEVDTTTWARLAGNRRLPSPLLSLARRPAWDLTAVLGAHGRIVLLENPRHLGNLGAAIRVAAAADAAAVISIGGADPWHPTTIRGGAGLQFAMPTVRVDSATDIVAAIRAHDRPIVALHPQGRALTAGLVGDRAVVAFGTERHGLSPELLGEVDAVLSLPMRAGVASLNLATAVAVTLYCDATAGADARDRHT